MLSHIPKRSEHSVFVASSEFIIRQKHGTMMVISDRAETESGRLSRQSTLIEPRELTEWEIQAVSSIDGAVLFRHSGICHAIGVILDGLETEKGYPARGARYNSAVRYLSTREYGLVHDPQSDARPDVFAGHFCERETRPQHLPVECTHVKDLRVTIH
jgi:hypothetical protein